MTLNSNDFRESFKNPSREYRPIAFWFLNHRLEKDELVRQIHEMAEKGMGGFMFHSRDGLRTGYLQEDWKVALKVAIEEADRLGLEVWLYDENHYPSGAAGNLLPMYDPDRTMKSLTMVWEMTVDSGQTVQAKIDVKSASYMVLAVSLETGNKLDITDRFNQGCLNWCVPGNWGKSAIMILGEVSWQPLAGHKFSYYPDYLDPELTDEFIAITHQWYYRNFGDYFGKTIRGIFSDNSCGNFGYLRRSIPWGKDLENRFKMATGEDLRRHIPALFYSQVPDSRRSRMIFWRFFGQIYLNSYFSRIKNYCDRVGLLSTGHLCLEDGMGEHVRQVGDYFEVMRHLSLTAVDQLGPEKKGESLRWSYGEHLPCAIKNTCSAARFTGSPRVMCESFGLAGGSPWSLDLFEIKRISGWLAAIGIDLFVPHGLYYSIAGSRKWESTPDHLHNPMWEYYSQWTNWISRISLANSGGSTRAEVAVLYPIHSLRSALEVGRQDTEASSDRGSGTDLVESTYQFAVEQLFREHIDFEIIDEEILSSAEPFENGMLQVSSPNSKYIPMNIQVVILPAITVLEERTVHLLERFIHAGGTVLCLNTVPESSFEPDTGNVYPLSKFADGKARLLHISPDDNSPKIKDFLYALISNRIKRNIIVDMLQNEDDSEIITRSWVKEGHHYYFAFNPTGETFRKVRLTMNETQPLVQISLQTGEIIPWKEDGIYNFDPAEGLLWVTMPELNKRSASSCSETIIKTIELNGTWEFMPDRFNVLPLRQWTTLCDDASQAYRFVFFSDIEVPRAILLMDQERSNPELDSHSFSQRFHCILNGKEITEFSVGTYLDRNIYEAKIDGVVVQGENILEIQCDARLSDWEFRLWPPMVAGDFHVKQKNNEYVISQSTSQIQQGSWVEQGYPYISGEGGYARTIEIPAIDRGEKIILDLGDIANAVRIEINGSLVGVRISPPWTFDLTAFSGKQVCMKIKVINTPHNLFESGFVPAGLLGPVVLRVMQ